jgi:peptidoglycan/LPS O-acetylase OafA/YrhL
MRLTRLDGLRGLAASGVVLYHLANWPGLDVTLDPVTGWVFRHGWTLVDLFFTISGYVFAHVYAAPGQLVQAGALRGFWVARVARLWPLHAAVLLVLALTTWGGANNAPHFVAHLFMAQSLDLDTARSFNSASWSLSIEILCYAAFSLAARIADRALWWLTALSVLSSLYWLALLGHPAGPWFGEIIPRGFLGFFMGQTLWRARAPLAKIPTPAIIAALALGLIWQTTASISPLVPLGALAWPAAILLALRSSTLDARPIQWLGERSFGIYMVHMAVLRGIDAALPPHSQSLPTFLASQAAILGLTLALAQACYFAIELPGRRLIRRWAMPADRPEFSATIPTPSEIPHRSERRQKNPLSPAQPHAPASAFPGRHP